MECGLCTRNLTQIYDDLIHRKGSPSTRKQLAMFERGSSVLLNTEVVPASSPVLVNVPALDQLSLESAVQSNLKDIVTGQSQQFLKEFLLFQICIYNSCPTVSARMLYEDIQDQNRPILSFFAL
ncbi:hypothetical protein J6590_100310 [Homalodisca vitripennis]|nr:hypothetical protein J6590_100310 [Homalodisca vitripennis]